jgi:hypothetical protein
MILSVQPLNVYVVSMLLALVVGPYIHEGSHWFIGWLGNSKPKFQYCLWIIPNGVYHKRVDSVDEEIIRFSGIAPLLWIPTVPIAVMLLYTYRSPITLIFTFSLAFSILMSTESDALAFRDPEQYREDVASGELSRNPLLLPDVGGWLSRFYY